jgi:hypothetical protein
MSDVPDNFGRAMSLLSRHNYDDVRRYIEEEIER